MTSTKHTTKTVLVTPAKAADLLAKNTSNRRLRPMVVRRYAREMEGGNWGHSLDAIGIAPDGTLLNGQHRLSAVILSGVACYFTIAEDVDPGTFRFTDNGVKRTQGDRLAAIGISNGTKKMAVAVRAVAILTAWEDGDRTLWNFSKEGLYAREALVLRWAEAHDDLLAASLTAAGKVVHGFLTAVHLVVGDSEKPWLADQLERFSTKVGIEKWSLAFHLNSMFGRKSPGAKLSKEQCGMILKAVVAGIEGRELRALRLEKDEPLVCPPLGWRADLAPRAVFSDHVQQPWWERSAPTVSKSLARGVRRG